MRSRIIVCAFAQVMSNLRPNNLGDIMSLLLIIVVLVLLFGGGGGYYGYNRGYYGGRGHGLIWLIVIVVVLVLLFGGGHFGTQI